jgi:hypothetical protein
MSCSTPEKALVVKPTNVSKFALFAATTCSGVSVMKYLQKLKSEMVLVKTRHGMLAFY